LLENVKTFYKRQSNYDTALASLLFGFSLFIILKSITTIFGSLYHLAPILFFILVAIPTSAFFLSSMATRAQNGLDPNQKTIFIAEVAFCLIILLVIL
jgi:hypothetical protein